MGSRYRFTWPNGDFVEEIVDCILFDGMLCGKDKGPTKTDTKDDYFEVCDMRNDGNFQLFLILPEEMTDEQKEQHWQLCDKFYDEFGRTKLAETVESVIYKLEQSIDCFDLLKDGHALHLSIVNALDPSPHPQPP